MAPHPARRVAWREALPVWLRIAALSFGGPAGQIAVVHRILVEEKRWVPETRFLHAMNYCMLLPGPEAQQLVTYMGWLVQGRLGGFIAGCLFIVPGFTSILLLSVLYVGFQDLALVTALFFGLKPAVIAIIVQAVVRIGRRLPGRRAHVAIAVCAFTAMFVFSVPFPYIVLCAGAAGYLLAIRRGSTRSDAPVTDSSRESPEASAPEILYSAESRRPPALTRTLATAGTWIAIWLLPGLLVLAALGRDHVFFTQALFFSKTAMLTFGGAYSVLAYIADQAVENFGWLSALEMLDGLGLAETTPGPLIQVVQFVAFLGAYRNAAPFDPYTGAVLGSLLTVWVTFAPCFLWIFAGAPYMEALRNNEKLSEMLAAVTAAVTGVILNLALWFAIHTLFAESTILNYGPVRLDRPVFASVQWAAVALAGLAFALLFAARLGLFATLALTTAAGMAWHLWASSLA